MMTVKEYTERVIKPAILDRIRSGRLDAALSDPDCITFLARDSELLDAAFERVLKIESAAECDDIEHGGKKYRIQKPPAVGVPPAI